MHLAFRIPGLWDGGPRSVLPWHTLGPRELHFYKGGGCHTVISSFPLPHAHKASPSPHLCLPRCCSQSPRANLVPVLTLSVSSVVAGVVRSSVDMGKARGRAPLSSSSSIALHNDSCLSRASGWPTSISIVIHLSSRGGGGG